MVFSLKMLSQKHYVYFACVWCKSVHTPSLNIETSTSLRSFGDIICGDFCETFYLEIKNSVIILTSPLSCHIRNKLPRRFVNRREWKKKRIHTMAEFSFWKSIFLSGNPSWAVVRSRSIWGYNFTAPRTTILYRYIITSQEVWPKKKWKIRKT